MIYLKKTFQHPSNHLIIAPLPNEFVELHPILFQFKVWQTTLTLYIQHLYSICASVSCQNFNLSIFKLYSKYNYYYIKNELILKHKIFSAIENINM